MPIRLLTEGDFRPRTNAEAERAFGRKVPLTRDEFDRLSEANKSHAFTVANVANVQLLQSIRNVIQRSIRDGRTFIQISDELLALFDGKGIPRIAIHRLRFAYEQNARTAYADARAEALEDPETKAIFPFWRYRTVGNGTPGVKNVRAEHAALHHKVFHVDDPFWKTFKPPWDYGCRCGWVPLTDGQVKRSGVTVWTLSGGAVVPKTGRRKGKGFKLAPNPKFDRSSRKLDLSGLDADLRKLIEERIKQR